MEKVDARRLDGDLVQRLRTSDATAVAGHSSQVDKRGQTSPAETYGDLEKLRGMKKQQY